jgi:cation diffusion facilitator CzcD-associated flavoprotein CzcO
VTRAVDVAIIGAGPYGLAAAAHLSAAGVDTKIFGTPMRFWQAQTPAGMLLRSPYRGSDIGDPGRRLTFPRHQRASGLPVAVPVPVDRFIEYGRWFQRAAVPELDEREVRGVERNANGFEVAAGDDLHRARRVVIAAGIGTFARRPEQFAGLPPDLASHTLDHRDLTVLSGRRVAIIGGGQSALESAALLHEAGSEVDVLVREPFVRWLSEGAWRHRVQPVKGLLYAPPDVGPALVSHLVARPGLYRRMSRERQDALAIRSVRPAGAGWLRPRLAEVRIRPGVEVAETRRHGDDVRLRLGDGGEQTVDHVLLATGYRVDLSNYRFLPPGLTGAIACVGGYPVLSDAFETSVPGLHVLGAPAAWSFGPLMRFVAGSGFAARSLARGVTR